jgi:hypothetical protein
LVYAICCLWNFIQRHEQLDESLLEDDEGDLAGSGFTPGDVASANKENAIQKAQRDCLAHKLWHQYLTYNARHRGQ